MAGRTSLRTALRWSLGVLLLALGTSWALHALRPGSVFGLIFGNVLMGLAALAHAGRLMGWPRAWRFFALGVGLTFTMEALSVATQLATPYHYTAALGPQFLGVPPVVPLGWFTMLYASHVLVNWILGGGPNSPIKPGARTLYMALATALTMTIWDLTLDPYMVGHWKAWVWESTSARGFLGIPFANYLSWLELTFIVSLVFRMLERDLPPPPAFHRAHALAPVWLYGLVGLSGMAVGTPVETRMLPPFTMGIVTLAALARGLQRREELS